MIGPIESRPCDCEGMRIYGHYYTLSEWKHRVFLGFGFKEAIQYRSNVSYHLLERHVSFLSRRILFHLSHFLFLASALQVPVLCIVVTHKANVQIQECEYYKLVFPICILGGEIKK